MRLSIGGEIGANSCVEGVGPLSLLEGEVNSESRFICSSHAHL